MRNAFCAAMILVAGAAPCLAAEATVNSYTPSEAAKAKSAVTQAGYSPGALETVQDGNFFFTATKGDDIYTITVTRDGHVYASTGLPTQGASNTSG